MASTYLTRTPSSASNRRTFTISTWVKLASLGGNTTSIFSAWYADSTVGHFVFRGSSDKFGWSQWSNDSYSTRLFRDVNGWYHVVLAVDTTQATASNRIKMYVNGVQETSFSVGAVYPSQNEELSVNNNNIQTIGSNNYSSNAEFWKGSMSHFHFIDGTAYDATAFGETDATTGEWKIKTSPSVTYGTNGFFILKDGNSVTDQSGNTNNFTVSGGTLTKTEDNPSNVFATYNPLGNFFPADTFSNGNTTQTTNAGNYTYNISTLGASDGKYYCEIKNSTNNNNCMGIVDRPSTSTSDELTGTTYGWGYVTGGQIYSNGSIVATYNSVTTNDIIGIALDLDNNKVYFSKNGTWQGSSDPSAGTGGISITDPASNRTGFYFFASGDSATNSAVNQANFGNGFFGTTAVASAGTNASGNGIFEYDVPTGYTALSTKGLNL